MSENICNGMCLTPSSNGEGYDKIYDCDFKCKPIKCPKCVNERPQCILNFNNGLCKGCNEKPLDASNYVINIGKYSGKIISSLLMKDLIWIAGFKLRSGKKYKLTSLCYLRTKSCYPEDVKNVKIYLHNRCLNCEEKIYGPKGGIFHDECDKTETP